MRCRGMSCSSLERDHPVVEEVGGGQRRLAIPRVAASPRPRAGSKLGEGDLGVGVDQGLLVDASDALQRADIGRCPGRRNSRGIRRRTRRGPPCRPWLSRERRPALRSGSGRPEPSSPRAPSAGASWSAGRGAARPSVRRTARWIIPCLASSLATCVCPQAGWSIAMATTASSIAGATRFFRIGLRRDSS